VEYKYVDDIDNGAIKVLDYGRHKFVDGEYYYFDDVFYYYNGLQYRELHINEIKGTNSKYVALLSDQGKKVHVYYLKFKKLYDLV
jgi:hypothetical protein